MYIYIYTHMCVYIIQFDIQPDTPQERIGPGCSCIDPSTAEAVASATPGAALRCCKP